MNLYTQYRIKNNSNSLKYLRENSNWYKYLNRNSSYIKPFEEEMKQRYKLTTKDKVDKLVDSLDTVSQLLDILSWYIFFFVINYL